MKAKQLVLTINPGSTSTKIAVYEDQNVVMCENILHSNEALKNFATIIDQLQYRIDLIVQQLKNSAVNLSDLDAIVGRGGILRPLESGTYMINQKMINELKDVSKAQHASNLGAIIAHEIASPLGIPAFIVDPVVVDELNPLARYSGHPEMVRTSKFHALNQKAVARRAANDLNKPYDAINLIVAHLGGGISVGAHECGKIIDVNNALDGDGAFSPERTGGIPIGDVVSLCFSGKYTIEQIRKQIAGNGGLVAYLGTNDGRVVGKKIDDGDEVAKEVYEAMAYQISKDIAACSAVLKGKVDAICITGGLAYDQRLIQWISERISFIADIKVYPGEDEMLALAQGGLRVINGIEAAKAY